MTPMRLSALRFHRLFAASGWLLLPLAALAQNPHGHGDAHAMHGVAAPKPVARDAQHHRAHGAADSPPTPVAAARASQLVPRSPDYSDGFAHGDMPGMHMVDQQPLAMLRVDQLEAFHGPHASGQAWQLQGWYGNDLDKLWLRSEGERRDGRFGEAEIELQWSHAIGPFRDARLGVREDRGDGPARHWAAVGIHGLAPYWFELEATAYAGPAGRTAARVRVEYELRLTRRLLLQPELELNLYGRDDAAARAGHGLSDSRFGLRLRYEIRRDVAPYLGVAWIHRHGAGADFARQAGAAVSQRQLVAGLRFWF
jgi:copper resistance protein B